MLPTKRTVRSVNKKKRTAAASQPMCRESQMTKPEVRYYKETFPVNKNIAQMHSSNNPIVHVAEAPSAHPRGDAKTSNRMLKS